MNSSSGSSKKDSGLQGKRKQVTNPTNSKKSEPTKKRKSYKEQREKISLSNHTSWSLLRSLVPSVGHFKFTDVLFLWIKGERTGADLENKAHVVGVDLGSSHLGIVALNAKRHLEFFCVMDITKVELAVTPIPISKAKSKIKTTEDQSAMDNGLKVVHQLLKHRILNQLVRCDQWLLEQQMGTYYNPRTKSTVSGNVPARLVSMAIQSTVLAFHQLTSEEPLKMSQVPAKSKYDQAPLVVAEAAEDPLRQESLTGAKNELKRKILGRNDAFHLMEYLQDEDAISVLNLVEQNLVPPSVVSALNKKGDGGGKRIELDKIYDITDAYLIAQRLWYPSDVQKEKQFAKSLKKKPSKKSSTLQEMAEADSNDIVEDTELSFESKSSNSATDDSEQDISIDDQDIPISLDTDEESDEEEDDLILED